MNGHIVKPIDIQTVAEMPDRIFMQRKGYKDTEIDTI